MIRVFRGIFRVAEDSWGLAPDSIPYLALVYAILAELGGVTALVPREDRNGEQTC